MKLNNNDDSHNSGLNLLIYNMLLDIESHPTWVCGLKLLKEVGRLFLERSHPTWVCGLKHSGTGFSTTASESHPTWVCGLKLQDFAIFGSFRHVTPYVGVWIETVSPVRH